MKNLEKSIFEYLAVNLSPERFEHSLSVSDMAVKLASVYGENALNAQTAALLHDCAKGMRGQDLIKTCEKNNIKIPYFNDIKKYAPALLHSYVSAYVAETKFGVKSKDILYAVRSHTLGRPGMSVLEKIIFVADAVPLDRKHGVRAEIRVLARTDLDKAFIYVLADKIKYVLDSGLWLCPRTVDTWNFYAKKN